MFRQAWMKLIFLNKKGKPRYCTMHCAGSFTKPDSLQDINIKQKLSALYHTCSHEQKHNVISYINLVVATSTTTLNSITRITALSWVPLWPSWHNASPSNSPLASCHTAGCLCLDNDGRRRQQRESDSPEGCNTHHSHPLPLRQSIGRVCNGQLEPGVGGERENEHGKLRQHTATLKALFRNEVCMWKGTSPVSRPAPSPVDGEKACEMTLEIKEADSEHAAPICRFNPSLLLFQGQRLNYTMQWNLSLDILNNSSWLMLVVLFNLWITLGTVYWRAFMLESFYCTTSTLMLNVP